MDTAISTSVMQEVETKRIFKLDANGTLVSHYSLRQSGTGDLIYPIDITVDKTGNFYIVDEKGHRVLKYSTDGEFLHAFGEYGDAAGQFIEPFQIAALADGTLLVADTAKYLKDFVSTLPTPTRRSHAPFDRCNPSLSLPAPADPTIYDRWCLYPETADSIPARGGNRHRTPTQGH